MSDYRDLLERERRRFRMPGSMQELERRRDRRRRNRRIASGLVALIIAAAGIGAGLYAIRPTDNTKPSQTPTPSVTPPLPSQALPAPSGPIDFVDADHGGAAFQGKLYRTNDGGHTWSQVDTGAGRVASVDFVDGDHGWAIAESWLLATDDGGANWERVSDARLETVQFTSATDGWAVTRLAPEPGAQGRLQSTTDGGRTWTFKATGVQAVCAAVAQTVWIAGPGSEGRGGISVSRSTDGGGTWDVTALPLPSGEPWTVALRCGGDDAWALLQDGAAAGHQAYAAFGTTDGGQRWTPILQEQGTSPLGQDRKGVFASPDPTSGPFAASSPDAAVFINYCPPCFGSEGATVTATHAEGNPPVVTNRLDFIEPGAAVIPVGLSFVQGGAGWLLLEDALGRTSSMYIIGTQDGGQTWEALCRGPTCSSS